MRRPLLALGMFLAMALPAWPDDLAGQASIIDGDTIEIHGMRIRLWGIDAPESDQLCRNEESEHYRCGQKAANDLDAFIARRPVECVEVDRDRYQPLLRSAQWPVSILRSGWSRTAWRSTGPILQGCIGTARFATPRNTSRSCPRQNMMPRNGRPQCRSYP